MLNVITTRNDDYYWKITENEMSIDKREAQKYKLKAEDGMENLLSRMKLMQDMEDYEFGIDDLKSIEKDLLYVCQNIAICEYVENRLAEVDIA